MKKWLVGLVAAGLCAASAWAAQYSLVSSMDGFGAGNYVITGEKAAGEEHAMLNEVDSGDFILQQTDAATIVDGVISDPDASIVWAVAEAGNGWTIYNEAAGGYIKFPGGTKNKATTEAEVTDDSTWSISFTDGVSTVDNVGTPGRKLQYNKSTPRFACYTSAQTPLKFYKEGTLTFSVTLAPAEDFEVVEGAEATVTATAKNALGEVTYAWTVDGTPAETDGPELALPTDTVGGPYEVVCVATDGGAEGATAQASVKYTVVAAPQAYTVTVADGIENGSVAVYVGETELAVPTDVVEGTVLTVVATPATRSYKVESVSVTGESSGAIDVAADGTFTMPSENVLVSATFAPWEGTVYALVESMDEFEAGADYLVVAGSDAMKNEPSGDRIAVAEVEVVDGVVTTEDESIVWTIDNGSEGKYTLYNAAANVFVSAPSYETTGSASLVEDGTAAEAQWTLSIAEDSLATIGSVYDAISLQRNTSHPYFAAYKGGVKPYLFKKVGAGVFSVKLDPAEDFEVPEGEGATITATAKNAKGEVVYEWNVTQDDTPGSAEGNVWTIPADAPAGGPWTVYCTAKDGEDEAEASVSFSIMGAPMVYEVTVDEGIENGDVSVDPASGVAGTVIVVTALPHEGYRCDGIYVNGDPIEGNTFELPEGGATVGAVFVESSTKTATYTVVSKTEVETTGEVPEDSEATFECNGNTATQLTGGTHMTLTLKGYEGATITGLTLSMKSNARAGAGSLEAVCGDAVIAAIADSRFTEESWYGNWSTSYVDITPAVTPTVVDGDVVITISASANSIYCESFTVEYEPGTPAFSVALDPAEDFEVIQNEEASVTATAKNAVGEVTYAWTVDGVAAETDGPVLALPTEDLGPHEVVCVATDAGADGATAEASATYTVVEPKPTYAVVIADGILNGVVEADVEEAREGDPVTLTASPEPGYKLGSLTVSYGEETLEFTSSPAEFAMPAMDVLVTASFVERGEAFVRVTSLDGLEEGEYVITGAAPDGEYAMLAQLSDTQKVYIKQKETPEVIEADTISGPADSIVWTLAKTDDGWTIHNADIGYVGYVASDNTAGAEEEASAKSTWTISESDGLFLLTNVGNTSRRLLYNVGSTRFACYTTAISSNLRPLALYKKSGPAVFTVGVDKTGFEVRQGTPDSVIATAKNGAEPYSYVWTSETPELNGTGPELAIPDTLEPGDYAVTVTATDSSAEPQTASAIVEFTVVAPPPVFTVTVADGIENGTVTVDKTEAEEGETVTVTATPAENYKLEAILVNGSPIEGNTFEIAGDSVVSATFAEIVKYPVTIDDAIEHGTVAADKAEAEAGETVTLSCEPDDGWRLETYLLGGSPIEGNTFEMPEGEAVVSAVFAETILVTYVPVESVADLVAGEEYLVVAHKDGGFTSALKNENNGTRIGLDEVTIADDGSIATDNAAIVWEIRAGAEEGEYVLYNAAAGVYAAALTDGNTAQVLADGTDPLAQWTIDLADAPAVKIASVAYPSRWLQRNTTPNNKYFAAYTGSQTTPALYKKAGPAVFSVGFDKEDGFTVAQGTADSITAEAANGTEPYAYAWTGDLTGEGAVLEIPATLEAGEYTVAVTATDSSDEPQTATAEIAFRVVAKYAVTVADGIVGGEVAVDKALAEAGETVTVTATPASGYELVAITVDGEPIEGDTFEMPAKDVVVSATFAEVVDYVTLPFLEKDTPYPGPWKTATIAGLTHNDLDGDYNDGSAKFRAAGAWMQIKFQGTPGTLSFGIKGNGTSAESVSTFAVLESADGETWTDVAVFTSDDNLTTSRQDVGFALAEDSRYVQFLYREKGSGNVGIYDVYISAAGEEEPSVTVTGETTLALGGTFELALALENYTGNYAWAWEPATIGYVDPDTATFWWTPTKAGETDVTFSAKDGDRTIASATVTLAVLGAPALVFGGDDEGTVGTAVSFTVVAENVADPAVTFGGFLDVPEGSALTDEDVVLDYPNVTFTPDVAGEYGLAFSAGSVEGGDYVEDLWIVTVSGSEPPAELPEITDMVLDPAEGTFLLQFKGVAVVVYGTDDLTDAGSWAPIEGAVIDGDTVTVPMDKHFLRVQ